MSGRPSRPGRSALRPRHSRFARPRRVACSGASRHSRRKFRRVRQHPAATGALRQQDVSTCCGYRSITSSIGLRGSSWTFRHGNGGWLYEANDTQELELKLRA